MSDAYRGLIHKRVSLLKYVCELALGHFVKLVGVLEV